MKSDIKNWIQVVKRDETSMTEGKPKKTETDWRSQCGLK